MQTKYKNDSSPVLCTVILHVENFDIEELCLEGFQDGLELEQTKVEEYLENLDLLRMGREG